MKAEHFFHYISAIILGQKDASLSPNLIYSYYYFTMVL